MAATTFCLDCERQFELGHRRNLQIGQNVKCPHCQVELEIISLDPPELDWSYERLNPGLEFTSLLKEWDRFKL